MANREMDKKQRKIDSQVAEERSQAAKFAAERDSIAQEARERETKVMFHLFISVCSLCLENVYFYFQYLSLEKEMEQLKVDFEESERQRRLLQAELDEVVSSKDDAGKNVKNLF